MKNFNDLLPYLTLKQGTMPSKYMVKDDYHVLYKGEWITSVVYMECITTRTTSEEFVGKVLWKDLDWKFFKVRKLEWQTIVAPIVEAQQPETRPLWLKGLNDPIYQKARELACIAAFSGFADHELLERAKDIVESGV